MEKLDYKKEYKDLYLPKTSPMLIDVPEMTFLTVSGEGDPNTSKAYQEALELLYGLSFTIKMSKLGKQPIPGYFEYVVPPLEGLWQKKDSPFDGSDLKDKNMLCWVSMIRQPEFVTPGGVCVGQANFGGEKARPESGKGKSDPLERRAVLSGNAYRPLR